MFSQVFPLQHRLTVFRLAVRAPSLALAFASGCGGSDPSSGNETGGPGGGGPAAVAGAGGAGGGEPGLVVGAGGLSDGAGGAEGTPIGIGMVGVERDSGAAGTSGEPTPMLPRSVSWETRTLSTLHTAEGADAGDIDG